MTYISTQEIINILEYIYERSCSCGTFDSEEILAEVRGELAILKKLLNGDFVKVDVECNHGETEE